jgi:signal transduction histidine kinase
VINNLLSNAIKYSPENKLIIVHLSRVSNFAKFSITDQGMGIKQEDHKKIFDRFFRVDDIQKRFPGMGIGLYICDQIIKNHGGTLWVESVPSEGSTFSFTLPLNKKTTA